MGCQSLPNYDFSVRTTTWAFITMPVVFWYISDTHFLASAFKRWHRLHRVIATRLREIFSVERHRRILRESKQKDTRVYQTDSNLCASVCACVWSTAFHPPPLAKTNTLRHPTTHKPPPPWSREIVGFMTSLPLVSPLATRSFSDSSLPPCGTTLWGVWTHCFLGIVVSHTHSVQKKKSKLHTHTHSF